MKILTALFLVSLLFGQLGGVSIFPDVTVYVHEALLVVLLATALVRWGSGTRVRPRLAIPIAGFAFVALASLLVASRQLVASEVLTSSLYLVRWVVYAALYFLVLRMRFVTPTFWLSGLFFTGVGFGIIGILQYVLYPDLRNLFYLGWDPHYYRLFSTLLDPNFTGIVLVLTVLLGIAIWRTERRKQLVALGVAVSFIALLFTYSRSSYAALVVGVGVATVMSKRSIRMFLLFVLVFTIWVSVPKGSGEGARLFRTVSTLARLGNWQQSFALIAQAPILGHGFNTLRYPDTSLGENAARKVPSKAAAGRDSSILFILATTGIVGLASYLFLVLKQIRIGLDLVRKANKKHLGYAVVASFASLGVHSMFTNSLFYPWVMLWVWIVLGAAERER